MRLQREQSRARRVVGARGFLFERGALFGLVLLCWQACQTSPQVASAGAVTGAPGGPAWLAQPEAGVACEVVAAAVGQEQIIGDVEQAVNVAGAAARAQVEELLRDQGIAPGQVQGVVVSDYYLVDDSGAENPISPVRVFARAYACAGAPLDLSAD